MNGPRRADRASSRGRAGRRAEGRAALTAGGAGSGPPSPGGGTFAVLGLGEAGSEMARDLLASGAAVRAFDPRPDRPPPPGAAPCRNEADASAGADVVLSVNSAHDSLEALHSGIAGLAAGAVWADLNTASPRRKQELAASAAEAGRSFCDVALMSPVPGKGIRTPMLVSGPGAEAFASRMRSFGTPVEVVPGPAGAAAERKLLRSVFFKGMAAAVTEALAAARAAGLEPWMRDHLRAELEATSADAVDRMERGSIVHARRRADEMAAAGELLDDLGVPALVCRASEQWLRILQRGAGWQGGPSTR